MADCLHKKREVNGRLESVLCTCAVISLYLYLTLPLSRTRIEAWQKYKTRAWPRGSTLRLSFFFFPYFLLIPGDVNLKGEARGLCAHGYAAPFM
jgi:hypothetical protein